MLANKVLASCPCRLQVVSAYYVLSWWLTTRSNCSWPYPFAQNKKPKFCAGPDASTCFVTLCCLCCRYITSLYWAYTTMTTVGYGDIVGTTTAEKIWCIVTMVSTRPRSQRLRLQRAFVLLEGDCRHGPQCLAQEQQLCSSNEGHVIPDMHAGCQLQHTAIDMCSIAFYLLLFSDHRWLLPVVLLWSHGLRDEPPGRRPRGQGRADGRGHALHQGCGPAQAAIAQVCIFVSSKTAICGSAIDVCIQWRLLASTLWPAGQYTDEMLDGLNGLVIELACWCIPSCTLPSAYDCVWPSPTE